MANILDTAVAAGTFTNLVAAVQAAGLADTLKGPGPFTVFAPNDEAHTHLPDGVLADLLKPENVETLKAVLLFHVVPGKVTADELTTMTYLHTAGGSQLAVDATDVVKVGGATVIHADIAADNGIIHVIDGVLSPPPAQTA